MTKFKIGDEVVCIDNPKAKKGEGWQKGLKFKIEKITLSFSDLTSIYWPALNDNGVYEGSLALAKIENWRKELQ